MGRVDKGEPLPTVDVAGGGWGGREGDWSVREVEEGLLVAVVVEHVVYGGLKGELFVELMEVMGRTGYRKKRKNKKKDPVERRQQPSRRVKKFSVGRIKGGGGGTVAEDDYGTAMMMTM
jgi:hypothetical protein